MDTDKLLQSLRAKRDNFDRNRDDYDEYAFHRNLATVDALDAVIEAVEAALEQK